MLIKTPSSPIFCGLNCRLVATKPQKKKKNASFNYPSSTHNTLDICLFGLAKSLELQHTNLISQYGFQSSRSGRASAASNADIDLELWGQHNDWASFKKPKHEEERHSSSFRLFGGNECYFHYTFGN